MCGRFTQTKSRKEVLELLGDLELPPLFHGRYNIAPTHKIATIRASQPQLVHECTWGFTHPKSSAPIINARSETLKERPMFKNLVSSNRCLIPADGFYEWKGKQPYFFQLPQKQLFAFVGLWNRNQCVIMTRAADRNMQGIHHRMPIIIPVDRWQDYLTNSELMHQAPTLTARPVSRRVNKVINDDPSCIRAGDEQIDLSLFPDEE
jgi:putative SOS response-associated peptidase YedK